MNKVPISRLHKCDRFYMLLEVTGRRIFGTIENVGVASVTVRIDPRGDPKKFTDIDPKTGQYIEVEVKPKASIEHWSLDTLVYRDEST